MAFARHRGGGIFRGEPCASSSRALALRRLRGHSDERCYAKAGLDRGKARRDAAAPADGPLRRDLEKPRLVPLRRRLASCGSSAGKSRVDAPHGACRSGGSCYRTCGLQGMRGLRLHARALCDGGRLRLDGASLASPVRGKSLSRRGFGSLRAWPSPQLFLLRLRPCRERERRRWPRLRPGSAGQALPAGSMFKPPTEAIRPSSLLRGLVQDGDSVLSKRRRRHSTCLRLRAAPRLAPKSRKAPAGQL